MADRPDCDPVASTATKERFRLHVVSAALAILWLAGRLFVVYGQAQRPGANIPELVGYGIGQALVLGLAYLITWALYRPLGRSNLVANVIFCVMLLFTNCSGLTQHHNLSSPGSRIQQPQ